MNTPAPACRRKRRHGLTLLEVILALAVLGGSLAVIGELVRAGVRHAEDSRKLATAQILCETKMEEIAAGVAAPDSSSGPCETDSSWQYSVTAGSADLSGLLEVRVTVEETEPASTTPLSFTLVRWIMDPSIQAAASAAEAAGTGTSTSSASSSTSSAAGSSSTSGAGNAR